MSSQELTEQPKLLRRGSVYEQKGLSSLSPTGYSYMSNGKWNMLLWFLVVAIVIYLLLLAFKPMFVQQTTNGQPNGSVDQVRAILTSVIGAIVVVLVVYIFRESCYKY